MTTVGISLGHDMHARPVAAFSAAANASGTHVALGRPGAAPIDAADILLLMAADFRAGEDVELTVDGPSSVLVDLRTILLESSSGH